MSASVTHLPRCLATRALFAISILASGALCAQSVSGPLFDTVHTIAAASVAAPVEHTFDVSVAGTYQLTLTDLGKTLNPSAPLTAVKLAITSGDTVVGTPLAAAGSIQFTATPGTYGIHVVGTPGSVPGSGIIGIQVVNTADSAQLAAFSDTLATPPTALPGSEAVIDDTFTVASTANYQLSLTDLQFPQSLGTLTLLLIAQGSATPLQILPDSANNNAMQATVSLTTGVSYRIFAVGQSSTTAAAGLYGASVVNTQDGTAAYGKVVSVGGTTPLGSASLAAGGATLTVTDLAYPSALAALDVILVANGQAAAKLTAPGSQPFTAVAGLYQLFALGTASTSGSAAGSYAIQVGPNSGPAAFSLARGVTAPGSTLSTYSFDTNLSADTYKVSLTDFQIPSALTTMSLAVVQAGAELGSALQAAGTSTISASSGPVSLVAFMQATTSGGLFGVNVTSTAAGATSAFDQTQGVGTLFSTQKLSIPGGGNYAVTANDLAFPATFADYDVVVTQGTQKLGSIFGNGTFSFAATPGNYFLNFIAQPNGSDQAGTYSLTVASAPAPVVTLKSDGANVASGGTVNLTWTSQNATACTASGGWTGSQALNGTAQSTAVTANTTFTLTCSGLGGSAAQSVSVSVAAPSKGGGGSLGSLFDLILISALAARMFALHSKRCSIE